MSNQNGSQTNIVHLIIVVVAAVIIAGLFMAGAINLLTDSSGGNGYTYNPNYTYQTPQPTPQYTNFQWIDNTHKTWWGETPTYSERGFIVKEKVWEGNTMNAKISVTNTGNIAGYCTVEYTFTQKSGATYTQQQTQYIGVQQATEYTFTQYTRDNSGWNGSKNNLILLF